MKILNTDFSDFSHEYSLRTDIHYHSNQSNENSYTFLELFEIVKPKKVDINSLTDDFEYAEIGSVNRGGFLNPVTLNLESEDFQYDSLIKKISKNDIQKPKKESILIPKVRPYLRKFVFVSSNEEIYYTKAFINIKPKFKPIVLYYVLLNTYLKDLISVARIGKGYPTINERDLVSLKFNKQYIDMIKKDTKIETTILQLHQELRRLEEQVYQDENSNQLIDEAFEKYLKLDRNQLKKIDKQNKIKRNFTDFSNNIDLRCSTKFHRESARFVTNKLFEQSTKIKDVVCIPIMTGQGISPSDYEEESECYYISMGDISSQKIDYDNLKCVSEKYELKKQSKKPIGSKKAYSTKVMKNDILMMRSGEGGIGKVALVDKDVNAIFSDFIIRYRFNENIYLPEFCYYYMRSLYYQYLIEVHKKGLGNNTNIFPNNVNEFPIPEIDKTLQKKIVIQINLKREEMLKKATQISKINIRINQELSKQ